MRSGSRLVWLVMVLLWACRPGVPSGAADAAALTLAPPAPALVEPPANVVMEPPRTWSAQIKATPDEKEARDIVAQLQKAGVSAHVQRADLGARGIWFRVLFGSWPRRDLLELQAAPVVNTVTVRAILGPLAEGEAAFVPLESPASTRIPRALATALAHLAPPAGDGAHTPLHAHAFEQDGALRVYLVHPTDGEVHVLDAEGRDQDTIKVPVAVCDGCEDAKGNTQIVSVVELAGGGGPELLVQVGTPEQRALLVLARKGKATDVLLAVPLQTHNEYLATVGELTLRQLDTDADVELLWTGARLSFYEGTSLCKAVPVQTAHDVTPEMRVRAMDDSLHSANGVARKHGGAEEIRAFLKGTWDKAPELALQSALAYLAEAPDDAEIYRDVVSRAEAAGKDGRRGFQFSATAGLIAARGEWRAGLAPRMHDLLPVVIKQTQGNGMGCDESPLLSGTLAQKARLDPREALQVASRKADATTLRPRVLAALMTAYPHGSPLAEDVNALVELLEARAPDLVSDARQLKRAPQKPEERAPP